MSENEFTPGDLYMSKTDNNKVYTFIKKINEDKGLFVDYQNKEHDLYFLTLVTYKAGSIF
jgi:hypothetical protein